MISRRSWIILPEKNKEAVFQGMKTVKVSSKLHRYPRETKKPSNPRGTFYYTLQIPRGLRQNHKLCYFLNRG
ncbi:MAG: hypothetical protein ACUVQZ_07440, partial [Candidatus Caldatribacteriaceae bacterium]